MYLIKSHENEEVLKRFLLLKSVMLHSRLFHTVTTLSLKHVYEHSIANGIKTVSLVVTVTTSCATHS